MDEIEETRRKRLKAIQARLQVLWDLAEESKDELRTAFIWAEYNTLELEEHRLLRTGSKSK